MQALSVFAFYLARERLLIPSLIFYLVLIDTKTGVRLEISDQDTGPACPFHPPHRLEGRGKGHHYRLTRIPIKAGLEYLNVKLSTKDPFPWRLEWNQPRFVLGFVDRHWAKLIVRVDDREKLEAGQWFRYCGNEMAIDRTSDEGVCFNLILCSREIFRFLIELDSTHAYPWMEDFIENNVPQTLHNEPMNPASKAIADSIVRCHTEGIKERLRLEADVLFWIGEILGELARTDRYKKTTVDARARDAIESVIREIEKNPGYEYSLTELSRIGGINEHKLKAAFKSIHGKTPFGYLRETRMDHAAGLLREDRLSVIEVANEVGYSNASHFARAFKERHGLLPKAYQCVHRL